MMADGNEAARLVAANFSCVVCGVSATNIAQDLREVPSDGDFVRWMQQWNWRGGCVQHPAKSKRFRLNGTVEIR